MRVSGEPVCIYLFLQNPVLHFRSPESIVTVPPFGPIEGQKWFFHISSRWWVSGVPVCIYLFLQNPVFPSLHLTSPVHVVPPPFMSYHLWTRNLKKRGDSITDGGQNRILPKIFLSDQWLMSSSAALTSRQSWELHREVDSIPTSFKLLFTLQQ